MSASDSTRQVSKPVYQGEPTLGQVMRKPRWILALILAMVVAGFFAWLGQWQLSHAITVETDTSHITETARPISEVTTPGATVTDEAAGMVVEIQGAFIPGDFLTVENRVHSEGEALSLDDDEGEIGAWITGHLETIDGGALAVAIGWAPTVAEAERIAAEIENAAITVDSSHYVGRYMPSDAATLPSQGGDRFAIASMSPAQLVNMWQPFTSDAYAGYLVLHPSGELSAEVFELLDLKAIASVPPLPVETISWLNLFYAIEWVVFAGFAAYLWYRLAKDDWEKTHELKLLAVQQRTESEQRAESQQADAQQNESTNSSVLSPGIG